MTEWLLNCWTVFFNNLRSNTRALLEPIIASKILERLEIDLVDMRSQKNNKVKWILNVKSHFSKYTIFYSIPNKKASIVPQFLYMIILHCGIPDIIQYDNGIEFKEAIILLLVWYSIKIITSRLQTLHTQRLGEQVNDIMKDKLRTEIEATGNPKWSEHLIRVGLALNTQGHFNLLYKMTLYEVFFDFRYWDRDNSLATPAEVDLGPLNVIDEWIDNSVQKRLSIIDEVITKFFKHKNN